MRVKRLILFSVVIGVGFACVSEVVSLRRQLNSPDPQVRADAAKRLGELRDRVAVPKLVTLLKDSVPLARFEAALALGKIGAPEAVEPLFEIANRDEREDVALAGTKALGDIGPKATEALIRLLGSPRAVVRLTAARGLGRMRAVAAVERLIQLLDDGDRNVRKAAISALRRIGDQRGMEAITRKLASPDQEIAAEAEEGLSGRGYQEQIEELRQLLRYYQR